MAQYIYEMKGVGKVVPPNREILKNIWLSFYPGAKIGVLGLNGAGKSTLLKIMAGIDKDIVGEARALAGARIGYLPQEPHLDPNKDVRGNVEEGLGDVAIWVKRFNEISDKFAEPMTDDEMNKLLEEQGELQQKIDASNGWDIDHKLEIAADALRLPPWDASIGTLSGGEKRRVALCKLVLSLSNAEDILLLDEPTNHLDAESVAWLEQYLHNLSCTVVAVTHDRYFLDNVAGWILELDRGQGIPYEGNYSSWLEQKEERLKQESGKQASLEKALKKELEWVRSGAKARQAKNKARLDRYDDMMEEAKKFQQRGETTELYIPPGPRLGDIVVEAKDISKRFGDRVLFENLSFLIPKGAIVGIIGPNGAGKSTLFKILCGQETPDSGEFKLGDAVKLSYVDQSRDALDGTKTVWQEVSGGLDVMNINGYEMQSRAYVGRFNFKGGDQQKFIKDLSGGERNRVHLAKMLANGGNMLLLDEPTNDLDVETLRALEEAIGNFPGCAMVISHDRWFLDRIATHIIAFEGDSEVEFFAGNYTEYEADRIRRLGDAAKQPHRIRYKKIKT